MVERHVVEGGSGEGEAEGDGTELVPVQVERGVRGGLGRKKKGADGAVPEDLGGGLARGGDSWEPEGVESVAQLGGPLFGPFEIKREVGVVLPPLLGGEVGQPSQVGEEADWAFL